MKVELSFLKTFIKEKSSSQWVSVIWDCGTTNNYRAGNKGAYDLRVVDNAAIGVHHNVQCGECCRGNIQGFRWLCVECDISLCSSCYFNDVHETRNPETHDDRMEYKRYETPAKEPVSVLKDVTADKVELNGIFKEARVKRGRNWQSGNEDTEGSVSGVGKVVQSTAPTAPGIVEVKWPSNNTFPYRVGAEGKVDLRLEIHASGGHYQPDHLPVFNLDPLESAVKAESENSFDEGDTVMVNVDAESFSTMQQGHGGYNPEMKHIIGKPGIVRHTSKFGVFVKFEDPDRIYLINENALVRLSPFSIGQPVRVKCDAETEKNAATKKVIKIVGETGSVLRCLNDSDVEVLLHNDNKANAVHRLQASWLEKIPVNEDIRKKRDKTKAKLVKLFLAAASEGQIWVLKDLQSTRFLGVNDRGKKGHTALHLASRHGHLDTVDWLLEQGADIKQKDDKNRSAIHHAAKWGQATVLTLLIRGHAQLMDLKDKKEFTPLQLATKAGSVECIQILIEKGCNVNIQDSDGDTSLYNAILWEAGCKFYRDYRIVDTLLKTRRGFDISNNAGLNAPLLAAACGANRVLRSLLVNYGEYLGNSILVEEKKNKFTVLHVLCYKGDYLGVKLFMKHAAEAYVHALIERRCKHGFTPLLLATLKCNYSIVEFLISSKANQRNIRPDVTAKDDDGDTAVHLVAATLDMLREVPCQRDSPEIYKIYQDIWSEYPGLAENYPGLSLMCYLVRHGCPWKRTSSRKALEVISNDMFRDVLLKYCPYGEAGDDSNRTTICALCESSRAEPGTIEGCNDTFYHICSICITTFPKCPTCLGTNAAYERNKNASQRKFEETSRPKTISNKIGKPLNEQIAVGERKDRDKETTPTQHALEYHPSTFSNLN